MSKQTLHYVVTGLLVIVFTSGTALAGLREDWEALATAIEATGQNETAARLRTAVHALSDEDLDRVYAEADLIGLAREFTRTAKALNAVDKSIVDGALRDVTRTRKALNAVDQPIVGGVSRDSTRTRKALNAFDQSIVEEVSRDNPGFPDAVGYPSTFLCPFSPDRSDADSLLIAVDAIQAARVLLESAKVLWSGLSRACGQVAVAAGFGANTELACIPADIVLFAAELVVGAAQAVVDHIAYCDGAVDSAEIEGSYERVGHIHDNWTCKFPGVAMIPRAGHGCNGIDDNCSGVIDECAEDTFGPVVYIDPAVRGGCYSSVAEAAGAIALAVFAFDDCGNVTIGPPDVQGSECDVTVAVTATDDCGNATTVSTVITIDGDGANIDINPSVNAPGVCYSSIDEAEQAVLDAATITDNCGSPDELNIVVHSSVTECALRVRLEVTDKCGNTRTAAATVRVDPDKPSVDIQKLLLGFRGEVLAFQTPVCYESIADAEAAVLAVTQAEDECTVGSDMVTSVSSAGNPCSLQVTSKAVDECGNENTDTVPVRVDPVPPTVTCSVVEATLRPPNHKMRNIGFTFTATDNCTGDPATDIFITSDETTASASGAGRTSPSPDAFILRDLDGNFGGILLRAERSSSGDGRVYEITVRATDECGNVGSCSANVVVPPADGMPAVDSGQFYDATQIN
jgi:hypothetical protein